MPRVPTLAIPLPVTFLGCGKLGTAVLDGLLASTYAQPTPLKSSQESTTQNFTPTALIACVHHENSASALSTKYENHDRLVSVLCNDNIQGVLSGSVIILGCKPTAYKEILSEEGMQEALSGQKVLVNLMVGVSPAEISEAIYGPGPFSRGALEQHCAVVNVTPNTAAAVRQSMTLIYEDEEPLPGWALEVVVALFNTVGEVKRIPHSLTGLKPVLATLGASTAAFFAVALEGVAKGAVELGLNEMTAMEIAAEAMRGAAGLVAGGETAEGVRARIATKGGSTAKGLEVLEREGVGRALTEAMRVASEAAGRMGDKGFWKKEDDEMEDQGGEVNPEEQEQESQDYDSENHKVKAEDTDDADMGK